MTKDISRNDQEGLVKTSAQGAVELSEQELRQVAGGHKNKTETQEFLKVELKDIYVSSVQSSSSTKP